MPVESTAPHFLRPDILAIFVADVGTCVNPALLTPPWVFSTQSQAHGSWSPQGRGPAPLAARGERAEARRPLRTHLERLSCLPEWPLRSPRFRGRHTWQRGHAEELRSHGPASLAARPGTRGHSPGCEQCEHSARSRPLRRPVGRTPRRCGRWAWPRPVTHQVSGGGALAPVLGPVCAPWSGPGCSGGWSPRGPSAPRSWTRLRGRAQSGFPGPAKVLRAARPIGFEGDIRELGSYTQRLVLVNKTLDLTEAVRKTLLLAAGLFSRCYGVGL